MKTIVETISLTKEYNEGKIKALSNVSIKICEGEFTAIIGKSESGKSTLLNMIGALDTPTSGKVIISEKNIAELNDDKLAHFRRRNIGFIFQSFHLISSLKVWENIVLPIGLDDKKIDEKYINELLDILGIESKINQYPKTLSGGEQQRVAIARALASKPEIILADEPTGNLDSKTSFDVIQLLKNVTRKYASTLIVITHDEDIAIMADRTIEIKDGMVVYHE